MRDKQTGAAVKRMPAQPAALPGGEILDTAILDRESPERFFYAEALTDSVFCRMDKKSYPEGCRVPRETLRYLRVLHIGFDGKTHIGELVSSREIAADLLEIFFVLYRQRYPIEKIRLIDEYDACDEASMSDNNSSCFNYRTISHSKRLSRHSYGLAVDINPLYNPYLKTIDGVLRCEPENGWDYADRTKEFAYKITADDLCCRLFTGHGFTWGGSWSASKDYQHFEKAQGNACILPKSMVK